MGFCFRSQFTGGNRTRRSDYGSGPENVYRSRFFPADGDSLFMLAGALMSHGGSRSVSLISASAVGPIRGGLAMVVAITGIIMGNIRFRCRADAAAIGAIMVPEMTKRKYERPFSGARYVPAAVPSGLLFLHQSRLFIHACTANVSIGDLFMAAYAPGICIGMGF